MCSRTSQLVEAASNGIQNMSFVSCSLPVRPFCMFALTDLNKLTLQFQNIHYLLISVFVDIEELWNFILKSQICLLFCIFSLLPAFVIAAINDSDCSKERSFPPPTLKIDLTLKKSSPVPQRTIAVFFP